MVLPPPPPPPPASSRLITLARDAAKEDEPPPTPVSLLLPTWGDGDLLFVQLLARYSNSFLRWPTVFFSSSKLTSTLEIVSDIVWRDDCGTSSQSIMGRARVFWMRRCACSSMLFRPSSRLMSTSENASDTAFIISGVVGLVDRFFSKLLPLGWICLVTFTLWLGCAVVLESCFVTTLLPDWLLRFCCEEAALIFFCCAVKAGISKRLPLFFPLPVKGRCLLFFLPSLNALPLVGIGIQALSVNVDGVGGASWS
mmetsp:Transcript_26320/g.54975  ORF Transcript_26320/g.54975 Transcript_26320/m.54975 type:complete len:254 (-) Transcript_26320:964-1725(-)